MSGGAASGSFDGGASGSVASGSTAASPSSPTSSPPPPPPAGWNPQPAAPSNVAITSTYFIVDRRLYRHWAPKIVTPEDVAGPGGRSVRNPAQVPVSHTNGRCDRSDLRARDLPLVKATRSG